MRYGLRSCVIPALALAGCNAERDVYPLPIARATALLEQQKFTKLRRNRQCGIVIKIVPDKLGDDHIKWKVFSDRRELFWFAARLIPVDAGHTRVRVEIAKTTRSVEFYSSDYTTPRPAMAKPARPAIEEAIAAVLEDREFDPGKAPSPSKDQLCGVQRGAIERGMIFSVDDEPADAPKPIGP